MYPRVAGPPPLHGQTQRHSFIEAIETVYVTDTVHFALARPFPIVAGQEKREKRILCCEAHCSSLHMHTHAGPGRLVVGKPTASQATSVRQMGISDLEFVKPASAPPFCLGSHRVHLGRGRNQGDSLGLARI